jgi:hypothetical protein
MTKFMFEITLLLTSSRQGRRDSTALSSQHLQGGRATVRGTQNLTAAITLAVRLRLP